VIVVHDAARPLATAELFASVVAAVEEGADAAIPAVAVTDTIKRVGSGGALETLDRTTLVAVQTPQAFRAEALRAAHRGEEDATDDAALVERNGGRVVLVAGMSTNIKITEPADLVVAEALLAGDLAVGHAHPCPPGSRRGR
jgi:2-C-methyl-D-erythritol 4-phosphate cytidylyltransferase